MRSRWVLVAGAAALLPGLSGTASGVSSDARSPGTTRPGACGVRKLGVPAYEVVSRPGPGYPPHPDKWARHPQEDRRVREGLLESARVGRGEQFGSGENARSADACVAARE
jgi:hypothetical protein